MEKLVILIIVIFFLSMLPSWVWTVVEYIVVIIVYGALALIGYAIYRLIRAIFNRGEVIETSQSSGGVCLPSEKAVEPKPAKAKKVQAEPEAGEWGFDKPVVIKNKEIRNKGVLETGLLSKHVGEIEVRGGAFERHRTIIRKEGILHTEEVGEIRPGLWSDKVYDNKGREIGKVEKRILGDVIVDKNGNVIVEIKD